MSADFASVVISLVLSILDNVTLGSDSECSSWQFFTVQDAFHREVGEIFVPVDHEETKLTSCGIGNNRCLPTTKFLNERAWRAWCVDQASACYYCMWYLYPSAQKSRKYCGLAEAYFLKL